MSVNRRQLLKALGLASVSSSMLGGRSAWSAPAAAPKRVVFFVQPHGHVPSGWKMPIPGGPTDAFAERSLLDVPPEEFSKVLRPLHPFRKKLLAIEGLAHTSVLADLIEVGRKGGDGNNHSLGVAGVLTGAYSAQRLGYAAAGGAISIDQALALRSAGGGRFSSRVYGADYTPNSTVTAFSFLGPSQASPMVKDPLTAFHDLVGAVPTHTDRDAMLQMLRSSVLDTVGNEYQALATRLSSEGQLKLDQHHSLVRDLEMSLATASQRPLCELTMAEGQPLITSFMKLIRMAFVCDLTRVATFVAPVPQPPEFGYPPEANVHASYAHSSIQGMTSCGQLYDPKSERAMNDLGAWYANHFATLLGELDSVKEGDGTLLDNTVVVWVTELATPTHQHNDSCVVVAGGSKGFFRTGRYLRYPQTLVSPVKDMPRIGESHNRLYVSVMQALGYDDVSFGLAQTTGSDGSTLSLSGPLTELR